MVNWDGAKFDLANMTEVEAPMESVCVPLRPGNVIVPNKRPFSSLAAVCKKLHGRTVVVRDKQVQAELSVAALDTPTCYIERAGGQFDANKISNPILFMIAIITTVVILPGTASQPNWYH